MNMKKPTPLSPPKPFITTASKWDIFNPTLSTRLWSVDCSDYLGGKFKNFWRKSSALKYISKLLSSSSLSRWDTICLDNNWKHTSQLFYKSDRIPAFNSQGMFLGYKYKEAWEKLEEL